MGEEYDEKTWRAIEHEARAQMARGRATFVIATETEITITYPYTDRESLRRWFRLRVDRRGNFEIID